MFVHRDKAIIEYREYKDREDNMSRGIQFKAIALAIALAVILGSMVVAGEIEDNLTY